jgi:predicted nucleic acid-binding protein
MDFGFVCVNYYDFVRIIRYGFVCVNMADAIVYATALAVGGQLLTSDAHFKGLPAVLFWQKKA